MTAREKKVLGILVSFVYLDELLCNFKYHNVEAIHGTAVILDRQGRCIYHPKSSPDRVFPQDQKSVIMRPMPKIHAILHDKRSAVILDHVDELSKKSCLASFAKLENGWTGAVFHYRDEVFQPIENIRGNLLKVNLTISGSCVALLLVVWIYFVRTSRGKRGFWTK